jgi:hypothetical protein
MDHLEKLSLATRRTLTASGGIVSSILMIASETGMAIYKKATNGAFFRTANAVCGRAVKRASSPTSPQRQQGHPLLALRAGEWI